MRLVPSVRVYRAAPEVLAQGAGAITRSVIVITVIVLHFVVLLVPSSTFARKPSCNGKYKNGGMPSKSDFETIMRQHQEWLSVYKHKVANATAEERADRRRANLCNANLQRFDLKGMDLSGADLHGANFEGNNLTGMIVRAAELDSANMRRTVLKDVKLGDAYGSSIDLSQANLNGADLSNGSYIAVNFAGIWFSGGNMVHVELQGVNMRKAALPKADLSHSFLLYVDLSDAQLALADLSDSTLTNVNLSRSRMDRTKLNNVIIQGGTFNNMLFQPENGRSLMIIGATGLSTIEFANPRPIMEVRKNIRDSGLRRDERALTSALRKFHLKTVPWHERYAETYLFGGWITDFGAEPWDSVVILIAAIPLFAIYYGIALGFWGNSGIWAVWPDGSVYKEQNNPIRVSARFARNLNQIQTGSKTYWWNMLRVALQFSILSAFHIGWRDLNVGTWISRLQPREYVFKATGWVRFVSGIQSLLSVYLLALWALTYFGRPFE